MSLCGFCYSKGYASCYCDGNGNEKREPFSFVDYLKENGFEHIFDNSIYSKAEKNGNIRVEIKNIGGFTHLEIFFNDRNKEFLSVYNGLIPTTLNEAEILFKLLKIKE